jgi:Protein of unknown function (DUF2842)
MAKGEERSINQLVLRSSPINARHAGLPSPIMSIRIRKLIGTVLLFVLAITWALLAMALAQSALTDVSYWTALLYYVIAGLGWVLPAMPLVKWMVKPDKPANSDRAD